MVSRKFAREKKNKLTFVGTELSSKATSRIALYWWIAIQDVHTSDLNRCLALSAGLLKEPGMIVIVLVISLLQGL